MSSHLNLNKKNPQTTFDKKVLSSIQHLQSYVKHRLYVAESTGIIPKNMYISNDIIDEGIVKLYKSGFDIDAERMAIKLKLFAIVDKDLDDLFKSEVFHKNTISTHSILEEELDGLKEEFTMDADLDFVMNEELNDISYKQDNKFKHLFLYTDKDSSLLNAFEIRDLRTPRTQKIIGGYYSKLPTTVGDIIDLHVFGKLNYKEISKIKNIKSKRIERILKAVQKSVRKNIG